VSENYSPQKYASYFGLDGTYYKFLYKANDQKFRQQVAKHLNNVYQELKQEFNTTPTTPTIPTE
jgi:predicted transcriptional regulator